MASGTETTADGAGMPQLDFATFPNQIFWLAVTLVAIYFVLSRIALPRIAGVMSERQGTITNDIAAAEELKLKAREAEEAYNQALAEARAEAQKIAAETKAEIQGELAKAQEKADAEIAAKAAESEKAIAEIRAGAVESVKAVAKDTTKEILSAMGSKADAKAVTAAVNARMKG
ncbi:F0F1 ATP synthase subunit B' [Maritimibacter sp. HL-12]|uniref:F0F1 ATP synthase subunit B' n=1 Tax=Maritimibacter sp. HL-12 TaxID=1162418 RepID=UPI000A0F016B|nr:F0F1 ATP synthase subunit B' [Maritimibacter sp. HL-12]SMH49022.1 F-type H+-transporting ATPase subunit b [Maritimibacter sp. HL-12]